MGVHVSDLEVSVVVPAGVIQPPGAQGGLLDEFRPCGYDGLQFGLVTRGLGHRIMDSFDARKHPGRSGRLVLLPLLASIRGVGVSLLHVPRSMFGEFMRPPGTGLSVGGNAAWLTAARVAPMATGFLFWALAAIMLPPAQLGMGSAVVAAALLTVQLGMLGVGPATLTLLPEQSDGGRRLVASSLLTVVVSTMILSGAVAAVTYGLGSGVGLAWNDPVITVMFAATALFAAAAYQLDHVGVAQERSDRALVRSLAQSVVQLAVLAFALAAGVREVAVVVGAVGAGALVSVVLGLRQLNRAGVSPDWKHGLRVGPALRLLKPGLPNHALMLADRAPGYLLPLIVAAALGPAATASWYMVWMMASAVFFFPRSSGFSLQTALAGGRSRPGLVSSALKASLALTFVAGAMLLIAGPHLLGFLGREYGATAILLPVLVPALLLGCVTQVYFGVCRAQGRLAEATAVAVLAAVLIVGPASLAAREFGLLGVSALWCAAQASAALIAIWRLRMLMPPTPNAERVQLASAATNQPTGIE